MFDKTKHQERPAPRAEAPHPSEGEGWMTMRDLLNCVGAVLPEMDDEEYAAFRGRVLSMVRREDEVRGRHA